MISHVESPRYEIKVPCWPQVLPQIEAWIHLHSAHWNVAYPARQVNNIYFDTLNYHSLNQNLGGIGTRGKLRLRWYGSCLDVITGARLELKYRKNKVGWKQIWPLDTTLDPSQQSWREVCRRLCETVDVQANLWLDQYAWPVLINCYQRAYYVSSDQMVRMTIDTNMRAYDQRASDRPNLRRPAPIVDRIIVELKASAEPAPYEQLSAILAHFPIRPDRHSKYVLGMLAAADLDGTGFL